MTKIRSTRTARVRDRRSPGGLGGFSLGGPRTGGVGMPIKAGGGLLGLLVVAAAILLPALLGGSDAAAPVGVATDPEAAASCDSELERVVCGAVDDVSTYWEDQYPRSFGGRFPGTDTVLFSTMTDTGCGRASARVGPFYCPIDQLVYLDLTALVDLQERFGATGDLAVQYIVAHEYGHHVQNVTGIGDRVRAAQNAAPGAANELSVAQELQADCFAGTWARSVSDRGLLDAPSEIVEAQRAAAAVGDDRIMEASGMTVDPEAFTHGSAEQREQWFTRGFETGDPEACTTFERSLAP
jgi:uncharacterized protein